MSLKLLKSIVPGTEAVPIFNHVRLAEGRVLAAGSARRAEVEWSAGLPACCVPFKPLLAFVELVGDGELKHRRDDAGRLHLSAGQRRVTLPTLPPEDFPAVEHVTDGAAVTVARADLAAVVHAVQTDGKRPQLGAVHVAAGRVEATDGARAVVRPALAGDGIDLLLPVETCRILLDLQRDGDLELVATDRAATWRGPGVTLTTALVEGRYPELRKFFPAAPDRSLTVARADLVALLDTVDLVRGSDGVQLTLADGSLRGYARDDGGYESDHEVPAEGDAVEVVFSRAYLRDALAAHPDLDPVVLTYAADTSKGVVFGGDELLLPMRTLSARRSA